MKKIKYALFAMLLSGATQLSAQVPPPPPPPPPPTPEVEEIFTVVEEMPLFEGCQDIKDNEERKHCIEGKLTDFIDKNMQYPAQAKARNKEGTAVVRFVIDKDGSVKDPTLLKDPGYGMGAEALRLVKLMKNDKTLRWMPGSARKKAVKVMFNLPVKFKLDKKTQLDNSELDLEEALESAVEEKREEELFVVVEDMPRFPGCEEEARSDRDKCSREKLNNFVNKNLRFPKMAKENGVQGTVVVQFVVEADGSITNIKLLRDIGAGCGEEAIRIVKLMSEQGIKWIAGKQRGKPVRVSYTLPFSFKK